MKKIMSVLGLVYAMSFAAMGEELMITSFSGNGMLAWAYPTNGVTGYRVEWASQAGGPYTNFAWAAALLDAIMPTGATMAAAVPMFYRVVATTTNPPAPPIEGMVFVPGGTLPDIGNGALNVTSFYIGKYEVTKAQWDEVYSWAIGNGYAFDNAGGGCATNHPVHTVSWYDVVKWCNARSEKEGLTPAYTASGSVYRIRQTNDVAVNAAANGYRLPTDAQWEFAARGGTLSQGYEYSGGNDVGAVAWYGDNSSGAACKYWETRGTGPVGGMAANELGIYDMSGNVWEWCFDWYPGYEGSSRVKRGGSWISLAGYCRSASRRNSFPDYWDIIQGFRPARILP